MFSKILVANRGEIACRIFKSAAAMGIKTVAVFSDADRRARHTLMADESVHIGPSSASESYLVIDKIIDACKATGARAVHPGYGFLSERAEFAERLKAAGVAFIGPPVGAIEKMGDKITSKKIAAQAGVSTVPGFMGLIDDADHAAKIAAEIGYPVMIKASAGGGGKGMRIAWNDDEAREGFARSKSEAASSFGDDRIFIEKFVVQPRHIEIQVLADSHGNCVYLGERECSIQRRNQKVIEEAPSPFLDAATRRAMGEQSVALAQAVGYTSAGTVEFIVDKDRNFYFLEMNTRLQVEHPVTELITGVDLVEQMIRVAAGEKLPFAQNDIELNGWAIESRLYAEDPYRGFLPSTGRLTRYRPPVEGWSERDTVVRNDTGVYEGGEISMFYDPMIAKLCTWGTDRPAAIAAMSAALDQFEVEGIGHNLPFCAAVMRHERFKSGDISTAFIEEEYPDGFHGIEPSENEREALISLAAIMQHCADRRRGHVSQGDFKDYVVLLGGEETRIHVGVSPHERPSAMESEVFMVAIDPIDEPEVQQQYHYVLYQDRPGQMLVSAAMADFADDENAVFNVKVSPLVGGYRMRMRGIDLQVKVYSPRIAELSRLMPVKMAPDTSRFLLCPMPGLVVKLHVATGDSIEEGQALAMIEAMKMENVLRAEKSGVVASVRVSEGESLAVDAVIMEFE